MDANQPPPVPDTNLFDSNPALMEAARRHGAECVPLSAFGQAFGTQERFELGALADRHSPVLHALDARGERRDEVEFHPAYHALMRASMAEGLHVAIPSTHGHVERGAKLFMAYQVESGHICPITMTHAAAFALQAAPDLLAQWRPKLMSRTYDARSLPMSQKAGVTIGMGMTERQGGTDVRANVTQAVLHNGAYAITGHKWFMSAPMCDAFLVLAQAPGGLTCFLMPRIRPDGSRNGLHVQRLKDKLGNRSNASSEVLFDAAMAERVGEEGRGIRTILTMVQMTRVDCAVASAGLMRLGVWQAVHHARHRRVFGRRLVHQPLMRAVLADLALEAEAATASVFRLLAALDRADDAQEQAFARLLVPAVKYYICKRAPDLLYECMECLGGNGYVEDWPLARAYREAPVNAIWEGSGNVIALDILRAVRQAPEAAVAVMAALASPEAVQDLLRKLAGNEAESQARTVAERLALLAAHRALQDVDPAFAEAWRRTRLEGPARATWGAVDLADVQDRLIDRILPD